MINDDDRIQKIAEMSFMFALLSHQIEGTYKFWLFQIMFHQD